MKILKKNKFGFPNILKFYYNNNIKLKKKLNKKSMEICLKYKNKISLKKINKNE
jgi:hypothetical protein